jgi:carboxypeptidase PM20D1
VTPVERFRALLRIPTVSRVDETKTKWKHFDHFIALLPELYPLTHTMLAREIVDGHSMLYRWTGLTEGGSTVLMAHYDVVAASNDRWEHPPFEAELVGEGDEQELWSRGALDDKGALVCILEAVEASIQRGFTPAHDVYLSFGHNEETAGTGAVAIVALLESRGIRPSFVIDEGGAIVEGIFPGVTGAIAVVGVSEKGIMSAELAVKQDGGHASTPPRLSATTRLARAIVRLDAKPFRSSFTRTNLEMIRTIGAHAKQPYRWVFSNLWLTRGLLLWLFARLGDETNAMIRTTGVVTQLEGSQAENALAESATAIVNVRIAIDSSVDASLAHIRRAIRDDAVTVRALRPSEPSPVSPTSGAQWEALCTTIEDVYPGTIVTPYIQLGASDSRHFTRICDSVYRFTPFEMSLAERGTLHAVNERIHVTTWLRGIEFYEKLLASA